MLFSKNSNVYGKVTIDTPKGPKSFWVFKEGNKVGNLMCNCTGNNKKTATQMKYNHETETVECPKCGKKPEVLETVRQYVAKREAEIEEIRQRKPLQVIKSVFDFSTGIQYYTLNKRIPSEDWEKVKDHFKYMEKYHFEDAYDAESGWYTREPEAVEKILGINKTTEDDKEKQKIKEKEIKEEIKKVDNAFNKTNFIPNSTLHDVLKLGDAYDHPSHSWKQKSMYGLGRLYVITKDHIILINNNGHDGADWSMKNIQTGGAGAIGISIEYDEEIANIIRKNFIKFEL